MRISAVIPVLDEEPTLPELHERVARALAPLASELDIVFVNDGSKDGSLAALRAIAARDARVVVVDLRRNFGKSAALAAGFAEARGEVLVTLDADLQDVPEEAPRLISRLSEGADLVTGRKRERRDPWTRRVASRLFNAVVSRLAGVAVRDVNSGFKAMRREVIREIPLHGELHRFLPILAAARGFEVAEVDVAHEPRRHGRSRYGLQRYFAGLLDPATVVLLTRYGKRPLQFFGIPGAALTLLGAAILLYLAVGWSFGHWIGQRPLLFYGVVLTVLGLQALFFGLLAELVIVSGSSGDRGYSVRGVYRGERVPVTSDALR
jgi:glycosyltransferase involved in cell wall biosynthesis